MEVVCGWSLCLPLMPLIFPHYMIHVERELCIHVHDKTHIYYNRNPDHYYMYIHIMYVHIKVSVYVIVSPSSK